MPSDSTARIPARRARAVSSMWEKAKASCCCLREPICWEQPGIIFIWLPHVTGSSMIFIKCFFANDLIKDF